VSLARAAPTVLGLMTVAVVLAGTDPPARAQEPAPAQLTAMSFTGDGFVELSYAWRFHPGDDPTWADPASDDSTWLPIAPDLPASALPAGTQSGGGWFRRHLRVASDLWGRPLLARVEAAWWTSEGERKRRKEKR